jgi:O-antigen/teichoic acid export membrane protein
VAVLQLTLLLALLGQPSRAFRPDPALMRRLAGMLGAGWLSALALFALPRIGFVLLGSHAPLEASGHYSVALTLIEIMSILPTAAGAALGTHFARQGLPTRGAQARAALTVVGAMTALCLVAALLGPILIRVVFGPAFAPAAGPFRALLPAVVLTAAYQVFQATLQVQRRPLAIALPPLAAVASTVPAAVLLVPALGIAGAVWSTILGCAVLALLAAYLGWSAMRS